MFAEAILSYLPGVTFLVCLLLLCLLSGVLIFAALGENVYRLYQFIKNTFSSEQK
jgi:hypothetical protein